MFKKTLLVGRTSYDGPKRFQAIIRQINKDLENKVTEDFIRKVILIGFSERGIGKLTRTYDHFSIRKFGRFSITVVGKKEREERVRINAVKEKESRNRSVRKYLVKYRIMVRLRKINERRAERDMKPITLKEFIKYRYQHLDRKKYNLPK